MEHIELSLLAFYVTWNDISVIYVMAQMCRLEKIKLDRGDENLLHVEFRRNMFSHFWDSLKCEN